MNRFLADFEGALQDTRCPNITECPFRAELCEEDDDCSPDSVCCSSPCDGKICTKQLRTGRDERETMFFQKQMSRI